MTNWVHKLEQLLREHPTPYLGDSKVLLAKRLAQCLNPSLPTGCHASTLRVYRVIFHNLEMLKNKSKSSDKLNDSENEEYIKEMASNLAYFSIGLFPSFQYSSQTVMITFFIGKLKKCFAPINILIMMIIGVKRFFFSQCIPFLKICIFIYLSPSGNRI